MIGPQQKGSRPRHPLFDPDLETPTVLWEGERVTIIIRRKHQTITAVFSGDRLETGIATSSEVEHDEDILDQPRVARPSAERTYNLRLDVLRGSSCTYTITNATEEAPA